jgi:hypothetical protein
MSLMELHTDRENNPVDVVERLASMHDWSFDRAGDDEIAISVKGRWTDYHVSFTWMDEIEALHLACAFDLKVPDPRRTEVLALIALINEQLWVGHFDMWTKDGVVMFRHALLLDTSRRSSLWCGPGKARASHSTPRCSIPRVRLRAPPSFQLIFSVCHAPRKRGTQ